MPAARPNKRMGRRWTAEKDDLNHLTRKAPYKPDVAVFILPGLNSPSNGTLNMIISSGSFPDVSCMSESRGSGRSI